MKRTRKNLGTYLGYPRCCIDEFVTLKHVGGAPRPFHGTGFIPCARCVSTITPGEEAAWVAENISPYRLAPSPFPMFSDSELDALEAAMDNAFLVDLDSQLSERLRKSL